MRAHSYWVNMTNQPLFFELEGRPYDYRVTSFSCIFLLPEEQAHPQLPAQLQPAPQALVQLYLQGYPQGSVDEHRRLVGAFISAGLLEQLSEPGSIIPTPDGIAILQQAGVS